MKYGNIVIFLPFILLLLYFSFSLCVFPTCASTENGTLLRIDNQRKTAHPNDLVQFDLTISNNKNNRENFIIGHVWENSVLWCSIDTGIDVGIQRVYDSTPFGNHGRLKDFDFSDENSGQVSGYSGAALEFDGTNDYVEVSDFSGYFSGEGSISFWANHACSQSEGIGLVNLGERPLIYLSNDKLQVNWSAATGMPYGSYSHTFNFSIGDWHHVVFVWNNTASKYWLYMDGSLLENSSGVSFSPMTNRVAEIGRFYNSNYFKGIIDEVRIYNRALTSEEIVWLYNNSWSENLSNCNVELRPGENTQVTFSVKVPRGAKLGYVQKFLLTVFPRSDPKYTETKTVTVEVLEYYDVAVSLDENKKSGKPEDILTFEAAVRNCGSVEDTYDISTEGGEEWELSLSAESIIVSPGEVGTVTISVMVPSEACPGDSTSFKIQATSQGDPSLVVQVRGIAIATPIFDLAITAHSELRQGSPGSEVTLSLELKNLGTAPDTFDLEIENAMDWDVEVDLVRNDGSTIHVVDFPNGISLENGETGKVAVRVRIPEDALIGQTKGITIQAVSRGDPRVSAESSISVVVVTPFWERPDVRFLVGLIIGAFVGATLMGSIILRRAPIVRKRIQKS